MAKRYTDTDKWRKKFIKGLSAPYKLLWFYICDDCSSAGIWDVDITVAISRIGEEVSADEAIKVFGTHILVVDDGLKWFIPDFIDFQYGGLNPKSKTYKPIVQQLLKYDLVSDNGAIRGIDAPSKGDLSPINAPSKGVLYNNTSSNSNNTSDETTNTIEGASKPLGRGIEGASKGHLKITNGSQVLDIEDCKQAFLESDVCAAVRELVEHKLMTDVPIDLQVKLSIPRIMSGWCDRFNETQKARLITARTLSEWSSHFHNWMGMSSRNLKSDPENLINESSKNNNGTGKAAGNTGAGRNRGAGLDDLDGLKRNRGNGGEERTEFTTAEVVE